MYRTIFAAAALALAGCGGASAPLPMAATPDSSRAVLVAALDGWKDGRSVPQDLADLSPPLYFRDDDLHRGSKLLAYQIEGDGTVMGTGYSYVVRLTVQDKDGAKATRRVAYTAMTEPKHAVSREDRKP